jgi:cobalt/nickel transport system permease protein
MIEELYDIERDAHHDSAVHRMDARIKILLCFGMIIAVVALPYTNVIYYAGALLALLFLALWAFTGLSPSVYARRLALTLPFGVFIIIFQIFFENPRYSTSTPLFSTVFGITVYAESLSFSAILLVKFILCISFIILLSSATTLQDLLLGARRLGLPSVFALSLGMMVRYLFVFAGMYGRVTAALTSRHFNPFDRQLPYRYRLRTLGYAVGMLFLRSYEQGERTYVCMLCRGYGRHSFDHVSKRPVRGREAGVLILAFAYLACICATLYILPSIS